MVPEAARGTCDPEDWVNVPPVTIIWLLEGVTKDTVAVSRPRLEV
jgi:hypothetical protein